MTWEAKVNTLAAKIFLANNDAETRDSEALLPTADRLQHLLSQRYQVQTVDGINALSTIPQQQPLPDLVIADVMLAGRNDWEWLRSLRSHPQTQDLTVLLLSAEADEEVCAAALAAGADDYLCQPFSDSQFLARIEVNLKMRQVRQATVLRQQELVAELVATKHQVTNILESMTDAFYTLDRDWCLTYVNRGGESVLGQSRHELLGKNLWELYPVLVDTQVHRQYHRAVAEGVPISFEFYYQPCDFWYDIHVYPSEAGISVYFHNISEKQLARRDRQQAEWAKQKSETVLNAFLASAPAALAFLDRNLRYVHANEALAAMNGIPVSEHIGRTLSEVLPERATQITPILQQVIRSKEPVLNQEISQEINSSGDLRHTLVSYYPVCLSDGYVLGVGFTAIEITRIKEVEQALRESEVSLRLANERFELAAQAVNCLIYDWNVQNDTVERTEGLTRILGYPLADTQPTGEWWRERVHPEDLAHVQAQAAAAWANHQERFGVEYRVRKQDDQYINVLDQGIVVEWGTNGQPIRVVGSTTDISEQQAALRKRQQAEQALQKHSERLKLLSETASDLLSTEHPLELMNDLFAKLSAQMDLQLYFNYLIDTQDNRQKLRLKSWSGIDDEIVPSIEWLEIGEAVCGLAAQTRRQIIVNNVQHSTHPNTRILYALNITAFAAQPLIARGKLLGVLAFGSRTRTHFIPEEIALLQATSDQIAIALERAELVASLQQQTEQLIQANRIKDEFLAVLSHELRTPLNPILGWSHLLRTQKYDQATTSRALETIERNAKLQTELIEDLLDVSRILQGKLSLNITQVDLAATLTAVIETIHLAAEAKSIQLQVLVQPNIAPVVGDSARLQQIVWNLLSNAVKFSPKNGQIEIRLESQGSQVQLQVRDTGKGISPEFLPFVFDYFRQADGTSTRKFGGLGLGLAIVRHLVELHGGTIKAESPGEGQGATFTVTLPLIQLHLESNHNEQQLSFSPDLTGIKVLVVDDDVDTRELISFILEQSGAEVMQARSSLEALQALTHFQPHVLLSDIGMPEMDGYMLIRQLRTMPSELGRQIPAIALTAYAGDLNQQQAFSAGFQTHITKPINPTDLAATIAKAVGRDEWRTC